MTTIQHILNWGEWQTVLLACGHRRKLRRKEAKDEQLYLGKRVDCAQCANKTKGHRQ